MQQDREGGGGETRPLTRLPGDGTGPREVGPTKGKSRTV